MKIRFRPQNRRRKKSTPKKFSISKSSHAKLKNIFFRLACKEFQIDKKKITVLFFIFYGGNPKIEPIHGVSIANPPKSLNSAFFVFICQFIHSMTHTKYQKYVFGLKSSHLKIGANGAGAYTIPQSVSECLNPHERE